MEDRIAPGSLLDLGMAVVGSGPAGLDKGPSQTVPEASTQPRSSALDLKTSGKGLAGLQGLKTQLADRKHHPLAVRIAGASVSDPSSDETRQWKNSLRRLWNDWSASELIESGLTSHSSPAGKEFSSFASTTPMRFAGSVVTNASSGFASQPGPQLMQAGSIALPTMPGPGFSNVRFGDDQKNFSASIDNLLAAGSTANDALLSGLSASNAVTADALPENVKSEDLHRLPQELRGRSDDLLVGQSLLPYAVESSTQLRGPTTGVVRSPAEYDPMRGVLYSYASYPTIVTDMVKELTEDPTKDDIAYVVVNSESQRTSATSSFVAAGANMSRVQFFVQPMNSVWIRDYGPHFITVDNALAIADSHYYPTRPLDSFVPTLVGDNNFRVPTYDMGLYFSGGNFQPGPNRSGFVTALVNRDNPSGDGFDAALISELKQEYLGIDTLHVLPQLPFSVDGTGHIDMWMYLVDQDTVIISEFLPGSDATAIQITNNAVGYMQNLGFEVFRTPAWNSGGTHFTYANAFRVNDRIFVPVYGTSYKPGGNSAYNSRDDQAIQAWQAAAGPGVEIIPIQCSQIIPAAGAIHCIVKQVPRYTGNTPAVNILSPAGGEIATPGVPFKVEWSAMDTNNSDPVKIDIYLSYGPNNRFRHIATTTDTGSYLWTPNNRVTDATGMRFMIIATSSTGSTTEVESNPFSLSSGNLARYDFSSGAGVNRFAYGSQTASWSSINANPLPVNTQLTSTNYSRLATSNAVGGDDADTNRYIAPVPSPTSNESTHVFNFQLASPINQMAQLDVVWEGYGDFATQVELYVWDRVTQNWGDGAGLTGVNRYMDSWSGNLDGLLAGSIRSNFSRYVDESGLVRFLVYTDRPGAVGSAGSGIETFHDYMYVDVKELA
jgi:agmatine/peptidylarginine deiminase